MSTEEEKEVRITIGLPVRLHQKLTQLSDEDRRSLRQEIVWLLERHPQVMEYSGNGSSREQEGRVER